MKYELSYRGGKYISTTKALAGHWEREWDLSIEARTVFSGKIRVDSVSCYEGVLIHINIDAIPARVDLDSDGRVWLHDALHVRLHPEPFYPTALINISSKIIWLQGEREQATIEEVGEFAFA